MLNKAKAHRAGYAARWANSPAVYTPIGKKSSPKQVRMGGGDHMVFRS